MIEKYEQIAAEIFDAFRTNPVLKKSESYIESVSEFGITVNASFFGISQTEVLKPIINKHNLLWYMRLPCETRIRIHFHIKRD